LQLDLGDALISTPVEPRPRRPASCKQLKWYPNRGFLGWVSFPLRARTAEAMRWFSSHPISVAHVCMWDLQHHEPQLWQLTTAALAHLRELNVNAEHHWSSAKMREAVCRTLATADNRSALRKFEMWGDPTLSGLTALVTSPHLHRLETLSIRAYGVGDEH